MRFRLPQLFSCFWIGIPFGLISCGYAFVSPQNQSSLEIVSSCAGKVDCIDVGEARIFVSSGSTTGSLDGDDSYDTFCLGLSNTAGLQLNYKAVMGTSAVTAKSRIVPTGKIYVFSGSQSRFLVGNSVSDLWSGNLQHTVNFDELYKNTVSLVITGLNAVGDISSNCSDWTNAGTVNFGNNQYTNGTWLASTTKSCSFSGRVYCIGIR